MDTSMFDENEYFRKLKFIKKIFFTVLHKIYNRPYGYIDNSGI